MNIEQYKNAQDAEEFVTLLNLFHMFYKKEYKLVDNAIFFNDLKEMQEFKEHSIKNMAKNVYCEFYNVNKNKQLLNKYKKIYHLSINEELSYTSDNIINLLSIINVHNLINQNWYIATEILNEEMIE
jgi:hypothetical protein